MEKLLAEPSVDAVQKVNPKTIEQAMQLLRDKSKASKRPTFAELHNPPPSFQRGKPLAIVIRTPKADAIAGLWLRYRHVNQAETWQSVEMEKNGEDYRAVIAGDYAGSPFPLQYYFQIRSHSGDAWLYPGLEQRWHGQPYFFSTTHSPV